MNEMVPKLKHEQQEEEQRKRGLIRETLSSLMLDVAPFLERESVMEEKSKSTGDVLGEENHGEN